jgi:oligo-1,6-glucosidase
MMRWWLDRGVDGFRMDVINMISKDPALPDGHELTGAPYGDGSPHYICGPRIHEFLQEMHREVFAERAAKLLTVGEMPGVTVEEAVLFTDPARREVDMVFQFEHVQLDQGATKWDVHPLRLRDLKASFGRWQAGLGDVGWNSLYWNNHDQPRVVSRFGDDGEHREAAAKMLATVLHMHHGTPYVYQGEELGMTNAPFHGIEDFRDIESRNHYAEAIAAGHAREEVLASLRAMSRDNARTPMQWDASPHAGFTTGTPWIPVNPNHLHVNAAAARADPDSVFHHYRRLIELRHTEPVVAHGDFTMLLPDDDRVYAFTRRLDDVELLVLGNFSRDRIIVDLPDAEAWARTEVLVGAAPAPGPLTLGPWEGRVHKRRAGG